MKAPFFPTNDALELFSSDCVNFGASKVIKGEDMYYFVISLLLTAVLSSDLYRWRFFSRDYVTPCCSIRNQCTPK